MDAAARKPVSSHQPYCFFRSGQWVDQLSRNWTICRPYGPNRPLGAGFRIACGKLLARFLLLCRGRYFVEPMVLSESCCGLGKHCLQQPPRFQFSRVLMPYGRGV